MASDGIESELRKRVLEFYQEAYAFEFSKRDNLLGRIAMPITTAALITGGTLVLLREFPKSSPWTLAVPLAILIGCVLFSLARAVWKLVSCLGVDTYKHVVSPMTLYDYLKQQADYNTTVEAAATLDLDKEFDDTLIENYASAIQHNQAANDLRTDHYRSCVFALVWSLIFLSIASVPYYAAKFFEQPSATKVDVTNADSVIRSVYEQERNNEQQRSCQSSDSSSTREAGNSSPPTSAANAAQGRQATQWQGHQGRLTPPSTTQASH